MSNVLSEEKKQQVIALGKLGWPLRRIEKATGVRRETAGGYLKAAGITVDGPGRRSSKPAIRVATDFISLFHKNRPWNFPRRSFPQVTASRFGKRSNWD
jgi:hypothetical protein